MSYIALPPQQIYLPPQIYLHPLSLNVTIQDNSKNATFKCMADGALSYYWIKENDNISSTAEGVNTNTLVLHNILPCDNGHYQCVAVNEYGRNYSNYATLTVEGNYYQNNLFQLVHVICVFNSSSS